MADEFDPRELLEKPMSDFPDRPNLPGGKHFYGKLVSWAATHSKVKGTPGYHVGIRLTDPGQDVTKAELDIITNAGFSISDYEVGTDFWLTPGSMVFLRRFMVGIGFPENVSFKENLSLDDSMNPTPATIDKIRGIDVIVQTPPADEQGRVYTNNLDSVLGVKRP
jgi:hypothetical protein